MYKKGTTMNANELADVFDTYAEPHDWGKQAQAMLCQQQAEIESLKAELQTTITGDGMEPPTTLNHEIIFDAVNISQEYVDKTQNNRHELTDEEEALKSLYDAIVRYENLSPFADTYAVESCEFQLHDAKEKARAILRKAQER